jgi:hypothetical protein
LDFDGNLLVTDSDNYTIRKVTKDGDVSTIVGILSEQEIFHDPRGIAIDASGIYIADHFNSAIKKVIRPIHWSSGFSFKGLNMF